MKSVSYDRNVLKTIAELSRIVKTKEGNSPIKIVKDDEGIHIKAANGPKTIVFTLDAPSVALDFEGNDLCFYNYEEFYSYFSTFENASIAQGIINEEEPTETEAIVMTQGRRKVFYPVSDAEVIKGSLKKIGWDAPNAVFTLTTNNLIQLKKIVGLLGSKSNNITFTFSGSEVTVVAKTNQNDNSFEDVYDLQEAVEEDFSVTISDEVFKYLSNIDYRVEVDSTGVLRFFFEVDDVSASILVTAIEEGA